MRLTIGYINQECYILCSRFYFLKNGMIYRKVVQIRPGPVTKLLSYCDQVTWSQYRYNFFLIFDDIRDKALCSNKRIKKNCVFCYVHMDQGP